MRRRTAKPASNPIVAGMTAHLPLSEHISMLGISSDHTDAAIMIPEAKPMSPFCTFRLISFLITNTKAEPRAVPRKGISREVMTMDAVDDILHGSDALDLHHGAFRKRLYRKCATCRKWSGEIF